LTEIGGYAIPKETKNGFREILPVLSLGLVMGMCIAVGLLIGNVMDTKLGIAPYGTGLGLFWGLGAALVQSGRILKTALKEFDGRKKRVSSSTEEKPQ
jgi:F0F1-type ATP synthase assembly protein I